MAVFKSAPVFEQLKSGLENAPPEQRKDMIKKVNGIFEIVLTNSAKEEQVWTIDLKKEGKATPGKSQVKPDIVINTTDDVWTDLAAGKLTGQKAFMGGKLKLKGNMMLAMKLDTVLKSAQASAPTPAAKPAPTAPAAAKTSVQVPGFDSSAVFQQIKDGLSSASKPELEQQIKRVRAIFQFDVKNKDGKVQTWTLDLKTKGDLLVGTGPTKADVILAMTDKDFLDLSGGKLNGQKAFMSGKLKVKGQLMLATKLDSLLKSFGPGKGKL